MRHEVLYFVPSLTKAGGAPYEITLRGPDLHCSCPAWARARSKGKTCKHVDLAVAAQHWMDRCARLHPERGAGGLCKDCTVVMLAAAARKVRRNYKRKEPRRGRAAGD